MSKRMIVAALAMLMTASTVFAANLPPGKWWRRDEVARRLTLTEEQQARLDGVFGDAANDLIDRKAEVEKATVAMRNELDQAQINRQNLQRLAAKLSEARGRLFEREVLMLADMRSVLNDQQWSQLRSHLDRGLEQPRRLEESRPQRPPMNGRQPRPDRRRPM